MSITISRPPATVDQVASFEEALTNLRVEFQSHMELHQQILDLHTRSIALYKQDAATFDQRHQDNLKFVETANRTIEYSAAALKVAQDQLYESENLREREAKRHADELARQSQETIEVQTRLRTLNLCWWVRLGRRLGFIPI